MTNGAVPTPPGRRSRRSPASLLSRRSAEDTDSRAKSAGTADSGTKVSNPIGWNLSQWRHGERPMRPDGSGRTPDVESRTELDLYWIPLGEGAHSDELPGRFVT